mmetsp:Transcript_55305/g.165788  ORF Transcript_55305/g.165788 Transcript_55305/m.165788 type:complete len:472 (+) Transcript_55305:323-1738(+)
MSVVAVVAAAAFLLRSGRIRRGGGVVPGRSFALRTDRVVAREHRRGRGHLQALLRVRRRRRSLEIAAAAVVVSVRSPPLIRPPLVVVVEGAVLLRVPRRVGGGGDDDDARAALLRVDLCLAVDRADAVADAVAVAVAAVAFVRRSQTAVLSVLRLLLLLVDVVSLRIGRLALGRRPLALFSLGLGLLPPLLLLHGGEERLLFRGGLGREAAAAAPEASPRPFQTDHDPDRGKDEPPRPRFRCSILPRIRPVPPVQLEHEQDERGAVEQHDVPRRLESGEEIGHGLPVFGGSGDGVHVALGVVVLVVGVGVVAVRVGRRRFVVVVVRAPRVGGAVHEDVPRVDRVPLVLGQVLVSPEGRRRAVVVVRVRVPRRRRGGHSSLLLVVAAGFVAAHPRLLGPRGGGGQLLGDIRQLLGEDVLLQVRDRHHPPDVPVGRPDAAGRLGQSQSLEQKDGDQNGGVGPSVQHPVPLERQ